MNLSRAYLVSSVLRDNTKVIFVSLLAAALILRIIALLNLRNTPYFTYLLYDERIFHNWALQIAEGTFSSTEAYEFAPLFPYLMAVIYKIFSVDILYIRILNIFLGTVGCFLVYLIGKELAGETVGIFSLFIATFYEPFIFFSIVPLKGALSLLLFAAMVYCLLLSLHRKKYFALFLCGVSLGFFINVRPHAIALLPLLPCLYFYCQHRDGVLIRRISAAIFLFLFGVSLAVSPFVLRNYLATGDLSLTTAQAGFNLYRANKLGPQEPVSFAITAPSKQETQFRIEASRRSGKKLSVKESSGFWKKEVVEILLDHPLIFCQNILKKTVIFFQTYQLTDHYSIAFMHNFMPIFSLPLFTFSIIMPLGMAGLLFSFYKRRCGAELIFIFIFYTLTLILLFTRTRYRLPLMAILIPMSVIFLQYLWSSFCEKKILHSISLLSIASLFFIIHFLPVQNSRDITAYLNGHAIALRAKKDSAGAESYWKRSSAAKGVYSDFANLSLAGYYLESKDFHKAQEYLSQITDNSYAVAEKYILLGETNLRRHLLFEAAEAYETSLQYNSGQLHPLKRLLWIYRKLRKKSLEDETLRRLHYIQSFYTKK